MNMLHNNNIIIAKYLLMCGTCLLSKLIDTQVARRGRQYHSNPATKKKKKKYISKILKIIRTYL